MKVSDYAFRNKDDEYKLIKDFLLEVDSIENFDNNWDPGRMDWWRYNVHSDKKEDFFVKNAHYWKTEDNTVVALLISEYGANDLFFVVHPDYYKLFPEVISWGLNNSVKKNKKVIAPIFTTDPKKIAYLEEAGFVKDKHESNIRFYDLSNYDYSFTLKEGFKLLQFSEYNNYKSRVELVQNAFENPNYTEKNHKSLQASPAYKKELDLVIVNNEGKAVAYCMGWVDEVDSKKGHIEPMGVHSEFRRNGFGSVLVKECFKRLNSLGVIEATIASEAEPDISNFLYDSMKPVKVKKAYEYLLKVESV